MSITDADDLDIAEMHRDFLLSALRAASLRARAMESDLNTIGIALKGGLIGPEVAVRWIMQSGLQHMVGELPESTAKLMPQQVITNTTNGVG